MAQSARTQRVASATFAIAAVRRSSISRPQSVSRAPSERRPFCRRRASPCRPSLFLDCDSVVLGRFAFVPLGHPDARRVLSHISAASRRTATGHARAVSVAAPSRLYRRHFALRRIGLATGNWVSALAAPLAVALAYMWRIHVEEIALAERFGAGVRSATQTHLGRHSAGLVKKAPTRQPRLLWGGRSGGA